MRNIKNHFDEKLQDVVIFVMDSYVVIGAYGKSFLIVHTMVAPINKINYKLRKLVIKS